jgi:hypothetical protein
VGNLLKIMLFHLPIPNPQRILQYIPDTHNRFSDGHQVKSAGIRAERENVKILNREIEGFSHTDSHTKKEKGLGEIT